MILIFKLINMVLQLIDTILILKLIHMILIISEMKMTINDISLTVISVCRLNDINLNTCIRSYDYALPMF